MTKACKFFIPILLFLAGACEYIPVPETPDADEVRKAMRLSKGDSSYHKGLWRRTFVVYSAGYNNLAFNMESDLEELAGGDVPDLFSDDALIVFSHKTKSGYSTPSEPSVYRIFNYDGTIYRDTLNFYLDSSISSDTVFFSRVLKSIYDEFPSESRGLLVSSHASGWIPSDYSDEVEDNTVFWQNRRYGVSPRFGVGVPVTKSLISHWYYSGNKLSERTMEIAAFSKALPYHLDFLIFDCCLMCGAESMYQLRGNASYIVATPTETMSDGFDYKSMCASVFGNESPRDVAIGVASDFYEKYKNRSGTVAALDCSKLDSVAQKCAVLADKYSGAVIASSNSAIQHYNNTEQLWFFYDLRDIFANAGATSEELAPLDDALGQAIMFKGASAAFLGHRIDPLRFSGISMYLPQYDHPILNSRYKETEWNKTVGLVR